jgi:hypothetical protein
VGESERARESERERERERERARERERERKREGGKNPLRIVFRFHSTTPSSLRLLFNVCTCTDPHHEDDQFDCPSCDFSFCLLCYCFKAFDQDIMLIPRPTLSPFSVILSLI